MPLATGDKLGPYEILDLIGAGGMGEVYRARDPRLNRDIAIKVSAAQFSERFEREAKAIAALNHPNICSLYDVGPNYLVMEHIEGEAPHGPLPLEEVLRITRQIADALEAAHEKGITHRDLKPGNIKIKPDGTVKVLDFGLAKVEAGSSVSQSENSPTLSMAATQMGVILGTAGYMSPEQARGKAVDKRADIWAFGVVFYELLMGKRLFHGEDVSQTMAAVIMQEPNLDAVPVQVRKLLQRCLEKDPKKRLRDISGVELLLESGAEIPRPEGAPAVKAPYKILPWVVAAGVLAAGLAALGIVHFRETPPPQQTLRYTMAAPEGSLQQFAISPDGHYLVMAATVGGKRQLWLRALDALQAQPMPFTEEATYPFWSPDSRSIGFFAQGKLKKVAASGGPAQSLCDAPQPRGGSWGRDDVIVFTPASSGAVIQRVAASGGVPADVIKGNGDTRLPVFLPDGHRFLYLSRGGTAEQNGIYVSTLDGKDTRRILADVSGMVFAPGDRTGHILFVRENTLMALPFDASSVLSTGEVFPLTENVSLDTYSNIPVTASTNGVLLYATGITTGINQMAWMDRTGKPLGPVGNPGPVFNPAISPDEKLVIFGRNTSSSSVSDLWLRDLNRGTETRFTSDASTNAFPVWSPQGDRIVFASNRKIENNLYVKNSNGSGQDELLLATKEAVAPNLDQWSRDGKFILYSQGGPGKEVQWVLPMDAAASERKPVLFPKAQFLSFFGQLSPDGHWMAFTSEKSGRREVYVRPFPQGDGEWTVSISGGQAARWRADGKELFFVAPGGKMMAVPVKAVAGAKPSFEAGTPVALFDSSIVSTTESTRPVYQYDVTADGKRFLIATNGGAGPPATPTLTVVTNWQAGVKK